MRCKGRCRGKAIFQAVFEILRCDLYRVLRLWAESDWEVIEDSFKEFLRVSAHLSSARQLSCLTLACAEMSHSTMITFKIENTTIRLRGSFSWSKYAMVRVRKSGCVSWICFNAANM